MSWVGSGHETMQYCGKTKNNKKNWRWDRPVNEASAWSLPSYQPGNEATARVISFLDLRSGSETRNTRLQLE